MAQIVLKRDCRVLTAVGSGRSRKLVFRRLSFIPKGKKVDVGPVRVIRFEGGRRRAMMILTRSPYENKHGGYILEEEATTETPKLAA